LTRDQILLLPRVVLPKELLLVLPYSCYKSHGLWLSSEAAFDRQLVIEFHVQPLQEFMLDYKISMSKLRKTITCVCLY